MNRSVILADRTADRIQANVPVFANPTRPMLTEHGDPGDANRDGLIDIADLAIAGANFNLDKRSWIHADFNLDGTTDVFDLGVIGARWARRLSLLL